MVRLDIIIAFAAMVSGVPLSRSLVSYPFLSKIFFQQAAAEDWPDEERGRNSMISADELGVEISRIVCLRYLTRFSYEICLNNACQVDQSNWMSAMTFCLENPWAMWYPVFHHHSPVFLWRCSILKGLLSSKQDVKHPIYFLQKFFDKKRY